MEYQQPTGKIAYALYGINPHSPMYVHADTPAQAIEEGKRIFNGRVATHAELYWSREDVAKRYTNVIAACKAVALLGNTEAVHCVTTYKNGSEYAGEAVNYFGGTSRVIMQAIRYRHALL